MIIGGGFGGRNAARALRTVPVDVTLIDRTNHHLFQPLLYQVALAALAPSDITAPIRWLLRNQRNVTVMLAEVEEIDIERRVALVSGPEREVAYDYLIVAPGSRHAYFGHDEWEPNAPGLKSLSDALELRRRFLLAFERAEWTADPAERAALQTFVIVGGGPTGVELAGMITEIARRGIRRDFRRIDTASTRVVLVEAGPRLLPAFPAPLAERARKDLEELGVEVRTGSAVTGVGDDAVQLGDERIRAGTVFWAAGNVASPLTRFLGAPTDRAGRVRVEPDLSVPGRPEIFVIGDSAVVQQDGKLVPGVAQGAMQMGTAAARNVARDLAGSPRRSFRYRNKGDMATIGRSRAIADFGWAQASGIIAWLLWLFIHILYLAGFRNRISVLVEWAYAYFTYQRGSRVLTEQSAHVAQPTPPPGASEDGRMRSIGEPGAAPRANPMADAPR